MPDASVIVGRQILVVEDEYLIASEMEDLLRRAGAEVAGPAGRVADALEMLRVCERPPDAAVLDVNLETESYPVADELARLGVPFLFATATDPNSIPAPHKERPCLAKPLTNRSLLAALASLLATVGR